MNKRTKVKQQDITDCGAACLASIAAHYRLFLPISRIRQLSNTDKKGTNLKGLTDAAELLGFEAKAVKGNGESLFKIPLPAIAHLSLKENSLLHYVVIYKVERNSVTYMDPATGQFYTKIIQKFSAEWTGIIVLLLPQEDFKTEDKKISNTKRFVQLLIPHKKKLLQIFVGALVYTLLSLSTSVYLQKIVDFVLVEGNTKLLNLLTVLMLVILGAQIFISIIRSLLTLQTGQFMDIRLILGYYKHLLKLPQRFFDTMRVGEVTSRLNDAVKIRVFINEVAMNMVLNILIVSLSIAIMFFYYWKLAVIALFILPFLFVLYLISNIINKKWQRILMENSADLESQIVESITAAGTIKRFGLEEYTANKTEAKFIILLRSIYKSSVKGIYLGQASELLTKAFTIAILCSGSYFVIARELSPGELLSFYSLLGYFIGPAMSLISANKSIQEASIAADRLFEIIDLETEDSSTNTIKLLPEQVGDIHFQNVGFRYGTGKPVFENLNLTIEKGCITAFVGESGSGKSTLLSLLQNIYPLNEGKITIGHTEIKYINNSNLRQLVCVVPQHIDLFAGTVIENIALGEPEPDMQKILNVCNGLGINNFIEALPNSYHTYLSEQGTNLSGGQRQRIAIARALYREPQILILDEATSSLDPASEQKIQDAIMRFKQQGKTIIVIAHRLSTIRNADHIFVLANGKVEESGNHESLIEQNNHYKKLWEYNTL